MAMEENVLMMRCTKCGEMNRLPVVHCKRKCGARLDFETAEQRIMNEAGDAVGRTAPDGRSSWAWPPDWLLLVVLLDLAGQMARTTGEEIDAKRYRMKTRDAGRFLEPGMPASQVIEEAEINAHLRELLAAQPPGSRGGQAASRTSGRASSDRGRRCSWPWGGGRSP
jgi:hypothetical protein